MSRLRAEHGLSLVEATIILMVLAALSAAIAPSIASYTNDARQVAAQEDVNNIGNAVTSLLRDTGSRCLRLAGTTDCTVTNRVDLLVSGGSNPRAISVSDASLADAAAATTVGGLVSVNWLPGTNAPTQTSTIDEQLILNNMATPYTQAAYSTGGPRMKLGWRGAYLAGPISGDPWGTKYQVNTMFLTVASNAIDATPPLDQSSEGLREAGWNRDVIVLSAGANEMVDTSFGGTSTGGTTAGADDVMYVITGGSR
jgi:type II secretory pathway pseudopilin PulG